MTLYNGSTIPLPNPKVIGQGLKPEFGNIVELFTINLISLGNEAGLFHFIKGTNPENMLPVRFDNIEYIPVDFETSGWESTVEGPATRPKLRLARMNSSLFNFLRDADDLIGCDVIRTKTFDMFLDGTPDADPHAHFPKEYYKIERKVAANRIYVEFELASPLDEDNKKIPARRILRDYCTHQYRIFNNNINVFDYSNATCPHTSEEAFFDIDGNNVSRANDICGKQLTDCKLRFSTGVSLVGKTVITSSTEPANPLHDMFWINTAITPNRTMRASASYFTVDLSGSAGTPPNKNNAFFPYGEGNYWADIPTRRLWRFERPNIVSDIVWNPKTVVQNDIKPTNLSNGEYWFDTINNLYYAYNISFYPAGYRELPFRGFPGAGSGAR